MNINEIHVDDFGAWHDLTLSNFSKGATVFYGPNEAGKTTLLNLIRTVLYGYSPRRCQKYLPPLHGDMAGGSLDVSDITGGYKLHRAAPANYAGGDGKLHISSQRGDKLGNEILTTLLAGVDETIFNNVFAVGLTQMQQLATLSDTEAASQLYGLAAGVDRVSLFDVTRTLEADRQQLLPGGEGQGGNENNPYSLDRLLKTKEQLQRELKSLRRDEGHYAKLRREHRSLLAKIKEKEQAKRLLDQSGAWTDLSAKIRKQWSRCKKINDRLQSIGPLADLPKHIVSRLDGLTDQIKQRRREWEQLRDERRRLKSRSAKHEGAAPLYQYAAEIEALDRQRHRVTVLEEEVKRAKTAVDELEFELNAELEELGLQTGTPARQLPTISDQVIDALREPAREARELRESVEALKKIAAERRKEAERVKGQLETAAVRFGGKEIGTVLQKGTSLVENLQRRIALDEQREGLVRQLDEVEDEAQYWQGRTVLPWRGVLTTCGIFSSGAAILLAGLLNDWFSLADTTRMPMMLIGGGLAIVSLVIKGAFESSAQERAEFFQQQIEDIQTEQLRSQEEVQELDRILPKGNAHLDQRLIDARKELHQLQDYLPLAQAHDELTREADAADYQATLAVRQLKDARRGWKAALRTVGLPDALTPAQIGQMTGRVGDVTRLRKRVEEAKRELRDREQELATIKDRIEQLLILGQVTNIPDGLAPQLIRLTAELEKHSQTGKEREKLKTRFQELKEKQGRVTATAKQHYANRRQLFAAHGLSSIRDYQQTLGRTAKAAELRRERDGLLQQISDHVSGEHAGGDLASNDAKGAAFTVPRLRKMLDKHSNAVIERVSKLDRESKTVSDDLRDLYEKSGQLKQKLEGRLQDYRVDQKELEIRVLDERIRQTCQAWHTSAAVSSVLDLVKQTYETKRQPVALAEASRHLKHLTDGRYTRIWTPMGRNALCIDDSKGKALPVEKLSRGTRELIFLALRLALASSYKRRGANMPIVLDDVFVNFDDSRARSAARALADVANSGQQMLIFTCHKRIRDIFGQLDADVRDLPLRSGLVSSSQSATPAPAPPPEPEVIEEPVVEPPAVVEEPPAEPAPEPVVVEPEVLIVESELPVYDADSWDEAIEQLSLPLIEVPPIEAEEVALPQPETTQEIEDVEQDLGPAIPFIDAEPYDEILGDLPDAPVAEAPPRYVTEPEPRVKPEWRDEWLEPLPDLSD